MIPLNLPLALSVHDTENDLLLIVADNQKIVKTSLGALRSKLGKELNLIDESLYNFLWVTDFPMY